MELGDVQIALDLGRSLDTKALPTERRVRHLLDAASAHSPACSVQSSRGYCR
jgi:hypothetical protein